MVPLEFLRLFLGVLATYFAFELGRLTTRLRAQGQPLNKTITWVLRFAVSFGGVLWGHGLDARSIVFACLALAALAGGVLLESRPKKVEEIHLFEDERR